MAMLLAHSIRQHMPKIDVYCGSFTNHQPSKLAIDWFKNCNVNLIQDPVFNNIGEDDSYTFLRTFTKDYFAKKLLGQYDFLVYLDIDAVLLKPLSFDFNPMSPMVLVEPMPDWILKFHAQHLVGFTGNLYYNWISIINGYNEHLYSLDFNNPQVLYQHTADKMVSNNIDNSNLSIIEQHMGGYHCFKPLTQDHQLYHYDAFAEDGTFTAIEKVYPKTYQKYRFIVEHVLNIKINNKPGYWESIRDETLH